MVDIEKDRQKGIQFADEMNSVYPFGAPPKVVSEVLADHLLRPHTPPVARTSENHPIKAE